MDADARSEALRKRVQELRERQARDEARREAENREAEEAARQRQQCSPSLRRGGYAEIIVSPSPTQRRKPHSEAPASPLSYAESLGTPHHQGLAESSHTSPPGQQQCSFTERLLSLVPQSRTERSPLQPSPTRHGSHSLSVPPARGPSSSTVRDDNPRSYDEYSPYVSPSRQSKPTGTLRSSREAAVDEPSYPSQERGSWTAAAADSTLNSPLVQPPQASPPPPTPKLTEQCTESRSVLQKYTELLGEEERLKRELAQVQSHLSVYAQVLRGNGYVIEHLAAADGRGRDEYEATARSPNSGDTVPVTESSSKSESRHSNTTGNNHCGTLAIPTIIRDSVVAPFSAGPVAPTYPTRPPSPSSAQEGHSTPLPPSTHRNVVEPQEHFSVRSVPHPIIHGGMMSPPVDRSTIGGKHPRRRDEEDAGAGANPKLSRQVLSLIHPRDVAVQPSTARFGVGARIANRGGDASTTGAVSAYSRRPLARGPPPQSSASATTTSRRPEFNNFNISESPEDRRHRDTAASSHFGLRTVLFGDVPTRDVPTPNTRQDGFWLNANSPATTHHPELPPDSRREFSPTSSRQLSYTSNGAHHQDVHSELASLRAARVERDANRRARDAYSPTWYK